MQVFNYESMQGNTATNNTVVKPLYVKSSESEKKPLTLTYEKKLDKVNALGEDIAAASNSTKKDNVILSAYQEEAALFKDSVIADNNNNINAINSVSDKITETVNNIKSNFFDDNETLKTVGILVAVFLSITAISNIFRRK